MVGDGKAVRLIPDALKQKKGRRPPGEIDGFLAARQIDAILAAPGSVDPASTAITCGLRFIPSLKDSIGNPYPSIAVGDRILISSILKNIF